MSKLKSIAEFNDWLATAKPGDEIVYAETDTVAGLRVAQLARTAAEEGLVFLAQRRLGECQFAYVAKRISPLAARRFAPTGG